MKRKSSLRRSLKPAVAPAKTSPPLAATATVIRDYPHVLAVARSRQDFSSSRVAIREGAFVQLEMTPTMVVVHDAIHPSPCTHTKLGLILYSYLMTPLELRLFRESGQTSPRNGSAIFSLLEIVHPGPKNGDRKLWKSECKYCGRGWGCVLGPEAKQAHISEHIEMLSK